MNPLQAALADFKRRSAPKTQSVELREDHAIDIANRTISIDDLDFDQELVSECLSPEEVLMRMEDEDIWTDVFTDF